MLLRDAKIKKPLLALGHTPAKYFADAAENDICITISNKETIDALGDATKKPRAHLKVDTGMHRQGILPEQVPAILDSIIKTDIPLEGIYTHLACASEISESARQKSEKQLKMFDTSLKEAERRGLSLIRHAVATGGALLFQNDKLDLVRIGLGLYGLWPSTGMQKMFQKKYPIRPALAWKTVIGEVKQLQAGSKVGYDLTEELKRSSTIATIPVGYWHGSPRSLSSISHVVVRGKRAKVVGRVSMDITTIDVTDIPGVSVGDEVILISNKKNGSENVTADELAELMNTISYEVIARINPIIERRYV